MITKMTFGWRGYIPLTCPAGGLGGVLVEFSPPTSEAAGSNLGLGTSCWKVSSYLPMPGGTHCSMHWFPPLVNYPSQYNLAVECNEKQQ